MRRVVVDTDVVSFIFKNRPVGAQYEADLAGCTLLISFLTLAELDRRHDAMPRPAAGDAQPRRLHGRAGLETDLPRVAESGDI